MQNPEKTSTALSFRNPKRSLQTYVFIGSSKHLLVVNEIPLSA